jgi:ADP-heptose:LPS heptosyltransferase
VIIHPGSSSLARRAPLPLLAETVRGLAAQYPTLAIGVGSDDERPLVASLGERMAPARFTSWAGKLNVVELAALLEQAHLFIGNDSGPLKMAEAVGARTLSFWGASSPTFAGPRGAGHRMLGFTHGANEAVEIALELLGRS